LQWKKSLALFCALFSFSNKGSRERTECRRGGGNRNGRQGFVDSDAAGAAVEGCGGEKWEVSKSVVGFKMSVCFWTDIFYFIFAFTSPCT
jgi:hypothetical protein